MRHQVQSQTSALSDWGRRHAASMMLYVAWLIDRIALRLFWLGLLPPPILRLVLTMTSALALTSLRLVGFGLRRRCKLVRGRQ